MTDHTTTDDGLREAVEELANRGVGTDLTPTVRPGLDAGWWYEYIGRLDDRWRAEMLRLLVAHPVPTEEEREWMLLDHLSRTNGAA